MYVYGVNERERESEKAIRSQPGRQAGRQQSLAFLATHMPYFVVCLSVCVLCIYVLEREKGPWR